MKISVVRTILLSAPYASEGDAERVHHLRSGYRSAAIVKIETDEGLYGLGEPYAGAYAPEVVRAIVGQTAELLEGISPLDVPACMRRIHYAMRYWGRSGISQGVAGAFEMALLDLKGKAVGLPVCELIGGRVHQSLPVYASGGNDKPKSELHEEMKSYLAAGYSAVKIRINNLSTAAMVSKVHTCHEALAGRARLALDAVQSNVAVPWTLKQAQRNARLLEPFDPLWLEEPLPPDDTSGLAELRKTTDIPIAGGETVTTTGEAQRYFESASLDIFQPDASVLGGIKRFVDVAHLAKAAGVELAVHAWCSGIGHMANYHAAVASENCRIVELSSISNPLREIFLVEPWRLENGHLTFPVAPGLGVRLPDDLEREYPYRPGSHYRFIAE
jgi:L-alanine-DL-glutamate epimerase-like enolase superfamily enzyme